MLQIKRMPVGQIGTNCYLLEDPDTKTCAVIDPGHQPDDIDREIRKAGLSLSMILITHGHFDHVLGVPGLLKKWPGTPVYVHEKEVNWKNAGDQYMLLAPVEGIHTVNGHSYSDPRLRSENTNFALLVSNHFTEPFDEPYRYGRHIASLSNMLAGGVLVQRFGDLVRGVRSNPHRMSKSTTRPTLSAAVPGDLSLALPKRQLDDIIEMIYALDKLAPGTANYDTLLYGAEVKFYSARLKLSDQMETALPNFFAAGDGAGITRGLAQAGASGVRAARAIAARINGAPASV